MEQKTSNDTPHTSGLSQRTLNEGKEGQATTKTNLMNSREQTDSNREATAESDDQQTLLSLLSTGQEHLGPEEEGNVISLHGPRHKGPRIVVVIHQEGPETR